MNDDLSPLEPEALDELLSADLDGELDAAARDLGLSPEIARARIRATPGSDGRRAALASARDLIASPPELEELLGARLREKAVRAAEADLLVREHDRKRRRNRSVLGACGLAASIVVAIAIAAGLKHPNTQDKAASAAPERSLAPAQSDKNQGTTSLRDRTLGSFTSARTLALAAILQAKVDSNAQNLVPMSQSVNPAAMPTTTLKRRSIESTTTNQSAYTPAGADSSTTPAPRDMGGANVTGPGPKSLSCQAPLASPAGAGPLLQERATLSGKPVVVLVFASNGEHRVEILDAQCRVVNILTMS